MAIGTGISDIFAGFASEKRAQGDIAEQQDYQDAAQLALQNEQYTKMATAIKEAQIERETSKSLGRTTAEVAGAGFAASGSALDILRESASQGALTRAVAGEQGLITEASYKEQANAYALMASAAGSAASADKISAIGDFIAGTTDIITGFLPTGGGASSGPLPGSRPLGQGGIGSA